MKKRTYFIYLTTFFAILFSYSISKASTTDPRMLLKRVQEKLMNAKSISYDAHCRFKFFDYDDTETFDAHVDLLREPKDTVNGCYILVQL